MTEHSLEESWSTDETHETNSDIQQEENKATVWDIAETSFEAGATVYPTAEITDIKRSNLWFFFSSLWVKVMVRRKAAAMTERRKNTFALANISLHLRSKSIRLHLSLEAARPFISTRFHFHPFVCIRLSFGESRIPEAPWGARPSLQPLPGPPPRKWQVVNVTKLLQVYVGESYCLRSRLTFAPLSGQTYYTI